MSEPTKISTGIEWLDHALDSLRTGDKVVWQINSLADYIYVANRFVMNIARAGKRIVYFRFGEHVEVVDADALAASGANAKKYELEDSFDYEGMMEGMRDFRDAADEFDRRIRGLLPDFLLLANERCGRCTKCTYPDAPCRFPEQLHPSLEGYGFVVNELAREAGVRYNNGPATVTYFGGLFFHSRG